MVFSSSFSGESDTPAGVTSAGDGDRWATATCDSGEDTCKRAGAGGARARTGEARGRCC